MPGTYTLPITVVNGRTHEITITAVDEFGNVDTDTVTFLADATIPSISTSVPTAQFRKTNTTLSWTFRDNISGLALARIELKNATGAWVPLATMDPSNYGSTAIVPLSYDLDADAFYTSDVLELRAIATDRAGNTRTRTHTITFDFQAPDVTGLILTAINLPSTQRVVPVPALDSTVRTWDNLSGLASVTVSFYNETSVSVIPMYSAPSLGGIRTLWTNVTSKPWPDARYRLNVTVTDALGNTQTRTLDAARTRILPALNLSIPEFGTQNASKFLVVRANVSIPGWPGLPVDYVNLTMTNHTAGYVHGYRNFTDTQGQVEWTFPLANSSHAYEYDVYVKSARGFADQVTPSRRVNSTVTYGNGVNLTQYRTYGALNATSQLDLYRFKQPAQCGSWFKVSLAALNTADLDLLLKKTDPSTITGSTTYDHSYTSTDAAPYHQENSVATGDVWTVAVGHKTTNTPYQVTLTCDSGGHGYVPTTPSTNECSIEGFTMAFACPTEGGIT